MKKVAIVMGSDSDLSVMQPAMEALAALGIPYEVRVLSAHRTPQAAAAFAQQARENGIGVIIAAAGKAARRALAPSTLCAQSRSTSRSTRSRRPGHRTLASPAAISTSPSSRPRARAASRASATASAAFVTWCAPTRAGGPGAGG